VTRRVADIFRFAWGLLYWNCRKSWFQLRPGLTRSPCQHPSDSGRAFETACDACTTWNDPTRFARVCPLLVQTPNGLRCSVDVRDVRPFWGRAFRYYGAAAAALYLVSVVVVFIFLRSVGYPISLVHLAWPPAWSKIGVARGQFFLDRANRAFARGNPAEGMLYLSNAHQFAPDNFEIAFVLAQKLQLSQPQRSDELFRELLGSHRDQRDLVTQTWFRGLLARGDFVSVEELARDRVLDDAVHNSVWMRALIFASRQRDDDTIIRQLLSAPQPAAAAWQPLLETELLLRSGRLADARANLTREWPGVPPYGVFYRISELISIGEGIQAVDMVETYRAHLDDAARVSLLLQAYAALGAPQSRQRLFTSLLNGPPNSIAVNLLAADLIRHPDRALFAQTCDAFTKAAPRLENKTFETYVALYCAAGVVADWDRLHALARTLQTNATGNSLTLGLAESFFRHQTMQTRIAGLLNALPAPLEVHYALLERFPGPKLVQEPKP